MFAPPQTPTDFVACRALWTEGTGPAGSGWHTIAHDDFLAPATPPTRFTSYPLEEVPRGTSIGLQRGQPLEVRLCEQRGRLGPMHVVGLPRPIQRHPLMGALGYVNPRYIPTVDQHLLEAVARHLLGTRQHGGQRCGICGLRKDVIAHDEGGIDITECFNGI